MSFARVIPLLRTPPGVEAFDYNIPDGMTVRAGDLVRVPFRKQPVVALVESILNESPFADRAHDILDGYADLHFPSSVLGLLDWTAKRTFCSKPTVLKSWLRDLPKRPADALTGDMSLTCHCEESDDKTISESEIASCLAMTKQTGPVIPIAHWLSSPQSALIARVKEILAEGKRVLILTPWKTRMAFFQKALANGSVLHSDQNDGDAFRSWSAFVRGESSCLIATRLGAWLAPFADLVLLDEPENDDHKQDDLAPRYDARLMAVWCAQNAGIPIESFGLTPPLHTSAKAPAITLEVEANIRQPKGHSKIPMIQADTLNALTEHEGPRVVIHAIRGTSARLACRDCGWRALCPHCNFPLSAEQNFALCRHCGKKSELPVECPSCHGVDLGRSWPGIEKLKQAWSKEEPQTPVEWRTLSNEDMDAPFPENALVVMTDGSMLGGAAEDIRRRERQCIAFRRLADRVLTAHGRLIIQCDEASALQWQEWLTTEGFALFQEKERAERRLFGYPPSVRLAKVIVSDQKYGSLFQTSNPLFKVNGPFPIEFRPKSREQRQVFHLIFPAQTSEKTLIQTLAPLANSAIIDLDPIAFFH